METATQGLLLGGNTLQADISLLSSSAGFCPVQRGNRAGVSRNEPDYSRRGTKIRFPLLKGHSCERFGMAQLLNVLSGKWQLNNMGGGDKLILPRRKQKKWFRSGKVTGLPSRVYGQPHSEKSPADFLALRGKTHSDLEAKKWLLATVKKLHNNSSSVTALLRSKILSRHFPCIKLTPVHIHQTHTRDYGRPLYPNGRGAII